jgi:hypothetical protein
VASSTGSGGLEADAIWSAFICCSPVYIQLFIEHLLHILIFLQCETIFVPLILRYSVNMFGSITTSIIIAMLAKS